MAGLIDRARKRVRKTVKNVGPMKRLLEGLEGKPLAPVKPLPTEFPKMTPAKKRKKVKPKK